jgi:hypothetical protein
MDALKIVLGCIIGVALAGLVLWALGRLAQKRKSDNISRAGMDAWFRRRRLSAARKGTVMDPVTIAAAIAFFGTIVVALITITVKRVFQWFQARGRIRAENSQAIAFTLADRINNKQYVEVSGVFNNRPEKTRIVQGFYDLERNTVIDARALASSSVPDEDIVAQHAQGDGLVIYT